MRTCNCLYDDVMEAFYWFLSWLYVGYYLISQLTLNMVLVHDPINIYWLMNPWANSCYCSYYERELDHICDS